MGPAPIQALPSVFPALPYPSSFKQAPLPTQSSFQPPLLLPTHCLSRLHVFMNSRRPNPCLSHIQDVSRRESRAEQKETNQKTLGKKSLKLVHKTSAGISRRRHFTTLPSVFQQGGDEEKKKNRKNATKRNLQVEEEKTLKSLSEEDLEWRLSGATSGTTVFH